MQIHRSPVGDVGDQEPLLIRASWPEAGTRDAEAEAALDDLAALVRGVRNLRTEVGSAASAWLPLVVEPSGAAAATLLDAEARYVEALARVRPIEIVSGAGATRRSAIVSM